MKTFIIVCIFLNILASISSEITTADLLGEWTNLPTPRQSYYRKMPYRTKRNTRQYWTPTKKSKGRDNDNNGDDHDGGIGVGIAISIENRYPTARPPTSSTTAKQTTSSTTLKATGTIQITHIPPLTPTVIQSTPSPSPTHTPTHTPSPTKHILPTLTVEHPSPSLSVTRQKPVPSPTRDTIPRYTTIRNSYVPSPTGTQSISRPRHSYSRGISYPYPSPTRRGATWTTVVPVHPTKHPVKTLEPEQINKDLEGLMKKKVHRENAKEMSKNMTKIFKKSSAKDMSKDDAAMAAQLLENIVSVTEMLNETADNVVGFIDSMMEMNTTILADSGPAATKIIKVLDKLVEYIPFKEGETSLMINKTNLVLQANLIKPETFQGIDFAVSSNTSQKQSIEQVNKRSTSIHLPQEVVKATNMSSVRVGFIFHAFNKLFQSNLTQGEASETVLSGSVFGMDVTNLMEPVVIRFQRRRERLETKQCVFWVESVRQWSNAGCSLCPKQTSNETVECCCNHLTSFAVLFSPQKEKPPDDIHEKILSIISYVGCIISLLGVLFTFITYSMFRHLRKTNQQPILMNLCIAIALLLIVFLSGINSTGHRLGCQIVAVLLHYLTLVTVLWMGIEAYNLYLQIVKVMAIYQRKFMLKAALVGWGFPLLIVLGALGAAIYQYKTMDGQLEFYYGNRQICVLHNDLYRLISWFGPILVILCLNFIAFIAIIFKLNSRHNPTPKESKNTKIKSCWTALAIMCLLGLTWLFGALAISDARIVFEYLFCIFNSLQGFFIFFFHCIRIKEVRSQWSLFVSGLGLSNGYSDNSQQRSRVLERLRKDSDLVHMRNFTYGYGAHDREQPKRKVTVVTVVGEDGCDPNNAVNLEHRTFSNTSHHSTQF